LTLTKSAADPTADYNIASETYDQAFTSLMGAHSVALLDRLDIGPGMDVVELACGTGHLTEQIVNRQQGAGTLRVVEKSAGMLAVARAKVGDERAFWAQGDMLEFLTGLPSDSADVVVCGWAICYSKPVQLLSQARRVLREGGKVGVIESRADALSTLRRAFEDVVAKEPSLLTAMMRMSLPSNDQTLGRWMRKAGLTVEALYGGAEEWPVHTPGEAVAWVERSGAGAGFRDSFDMSREDEIRVRLTEALGRRADADGGVHLVHPFVAGVAVASGPELAPVPVPVR
jgi:ubiquinone/menaquinone biosynthesis C-methylase UbiE